MDVWGQFRGVTAEDCEGIGRIVVVVVGLEGSFEKDET